jgi:AraC-like DNA-binding protein
VDSRRGKLLHETGKLPQWYVPKEDVEPRRRTLARPTTGAFRITVENTIAPLLPHGQAHATTVAKKLGMSERTLARRLATDGATFMEILQQLKANLAAAI